MSRPVRGGCEAFHNRKRHPRQTPRDAPARAFHPGRHVSLRPPAQSGLMGSRAQRIQLIAGGRRGQSDQPVRSGERVGGRRRPQAGFPERRKHAKRFSLPADDGIRLEQKIRGEVPCLQTAARQRRLQPAFGVLPVGFDVPVPVNRLGAGFAGDRDQHLDGVAATQNQGSAALLQGARKIAEAVVQPPPAGAAHAPLAGRCIVQNVHGHNGASLGRRRVQGGMIGQSKIVPKPNDDGRFHAKSVIFQLNDYSLHTRPPAIWMACPMAYKKLEAGAGTVRHTAIKQPKWVLFCPYNGRRLPPNRP